MLKSIRRRMGRKAGRNKNHQQLSEQIRREARDGLPLSKSKAYCIRSMPNEDDPFWTVFDGKKERKVRTRQIVNLDAGRWLDGYGY